MFKNRIAPTKAQEAAEDIFFGQIAIIWARWFIILAGLSPRLVARFPLGERTVEPQPA